MQVRSRVNAASSYRNLKALVPQILHNHASWVDVDLGANSKLSAIKAWKGSMRECWTL